MKNSNRKETFWIKKLALVSLRGLLLRPKQSLKKDCFGAKDAPRNDTKIKNFRLYLFVGIIAAAVGIYFRLYPLLSYTTADVSEKATVLVLNQLKTTVARQVEQNYPDAPEFQKNRLIKKNFDELLRREGAMARKTIARVAGEIQQQAVKTPPYLLESDSYDDYNLTENILRTGTVSDTIKGSKYFNPLMCAPLGYYEPLTLIPYAGYYTYRFLNVFRPDVSLMTAVGFTSVVVSVFTLVVFLLAGWNLRCGPLACLIGAVFFLLAPIFLKRSCFGWYDNDPYNTFFPTAILLCLFLGLDRRDSWRRAAPWAVVAAF